MLPEPVTVTKFAAAALWGHFHITQRSDLAVLWSTAVEASWRATKLDLLTLPQPCVPAHACVASCRTEAREELRRQVGTLRFDLNTLASTKGKEAKKEALAARKEFIRAVSDNTFCPQRSCLSVTSGCTAQSPVAAKTSSTCRLVGALAGFCPTPGFRECPATVQAAACQSALP